MNRREMLKRSAAVAAGVAAAPMINRGSFQLFAQSNTKYSARAVELVRRSTVVDMLNPFTLPGVLTFGEKKTTWFTDPTTFTDADFQRFKDSGLNVLHIAVGVGSYEGALNFLGLWNGFIAHHGDKLMRIDTAESLDRVKQAGKVGILLGLQNSDHFRTVNDIDLFWSLGQRVSQLTYNARNLIGNGATERTDDGLSDFGVAVVAKMNQVGMAVDVSHSGDKTTLDACEFSKQPVLFTHSNCRAISGHVRAKSDEAIRKMAATGGVMGITYVRMFVRAQEPTTLEHALDHYQHVAKLVGVEHVGTGSDIDLDGYDDLPEQARNQLKAAYKGSYAFREKLDIEGLDHPQRTYDLAEGLIRRGFSDQHVEMILGGNFKRVLAQIWMARQPEASPAKR